MSKLGSKKKALRKLIVIYIFMIAVVITSVVLIVMVVLGFGFDTNTGKKTFAIKDIAKTVRHIDF